MKGNGETARADISVSGNPNQQVPVPENYTIVDRKTGEPTDTIVLDGDGRAVVEVKTGNAQESKGQTAVYDACQAGTAVGCGGNAADAGYKNEQAPTAVYIATPKE